MDTHRLIISDDVSSCFAISLLGLLKKGGKQTIRSKKHQKEKRWSYPKGKEDINRPIYIFFEGFILKRAYYPYVMPD
jgi:hypothetical protein